MKEFGGSWSEAKLHCVHDYAVRYLQVMQKQTWTKLHYVDAFAGSGLQPIKKTGPGEESVASLFGDDAADRLAARTFIEGSPVRALRASAGAARGFDHHFLVEANGPACAALEEHLKQEFPELWQRVSCVPEDANTFLQRYLREQDWTRTRSLVFLDPFGLEVHWETVAALGRTQAADVWYLFPLGGAIRMMTRSGHIDDSWSSALDALFGTHDWFGEFYSEETIETLFGHEKTTSRDAPESRVVQYLVARLQSEFAGVASPAVLRNSKGSPLFALVLAVANPSPKALRAAMGIANHLTKGLNAKS